MRRQPSWTVEGPDWPNREASRFVRAAGLTWHVQIMGRGPVLLLVHGTGAATHSWRDLAPLLAERYTIVAPDLPGHGFSDEIAGRRMSLPSLADLVSGLLTVLDVTPAAMIGHSAGAAIVLRMTLDGAVTPRAVVSLNGALAPWPGLAAVVFPALAKLTLLNPFVVPFLTHRAADTEAVRRLIRGTGSDLDARGLELYRRLLRTERHVEATLSMMANWDLRPLQRDLMRLAVPLTLVAAERDRAVPPGVAREVRGLVSASTVVAVPGLGHLAHEEAPQTLADLIGKACV
jgi:magnesium chelatase accessory protein